MLENLQQKYKNVKIGIQLFVFGIFFRVELTRKYLIS